MALTVPVLMFALLLKRRFLPFFICQFCGAANDNVFRLALVAMLSFGIFKSDSSGALVPLSAGLFMLPFFLFSAAAGELIDALPKRRMLLLIKSGELLIMLIAAAAVLGASLPLLLLCLFLTGVQSAFFGPIKYSLLPTLLRRDELLNGNSWFSVSTFTAILLGTALGTAGGQSEQFAAALSGGFVLLSLIGLAAAALVPLNENGTALAAARFAPLSAFKRVYCLAGANRQIFRCILAGSWFWLVGVMLLNELPRLSYDYYIRMLVAVLVGVACGAMLCAVIFRNVITTKYAPLTLLIGGMLLWDISNHFSETAGNRLFITISLFTAVMTLYVVPLRTTVQVLSADSERGKIIAAYNIFNALFIVCGTLIATAIHTLLPDNPSQTVLQLTSLLSLAGVPFLLAVIPRDSLRRVLAALCRRLFRVRIYGAEHLPEKSTFVSNHQSLWDGILLAIFLESDTRQLCFPIDIEQSKRFLARHLLKLVRFYPLNPMEPQGIKTLIRDLQSSPEAISPVIFPEGRITVTGNLMKSYPGAAIVADKISDYQVTPIILTGLQHSKQSRMQGKLRLRAFPPVTINIFPPRSLAPPPDLYGEKRRRWLAARMDYIMEDCAYIARTRDMDNLTARFAANAERYGGNAPLFSEFPLRQLSYRQVYTAAVALGGLLAQSHRPQSRIGLMLPSSVGAAVCFYAATFQRLGAVFINPSSGAAPALSACSTAVIDTVYTSQRLLERSAPAAHIAEALKNAGIRVVLLETLRERLTLKNKLRAASAALFMRHSVRRLPGYRAETDDTAAVLFTSGSEGAPKGVALSHKNLIINCRQVISRIDINQTDVMLNTLPVFHSFGLLAGVVLPMMTGVEAWQYPSPLHYKLVPEAAYGCNATIFFSANTFLYNYGRTASPLDFVSLRLVFAGAEKLKPETRELWADKFGVRILEGYGVTETSPVISVNSPLHHISGTVGRVLPGIRTRVEPEAGIERGGRLFVHGDNVMQGYYLAERPGELAPPPGGWHDTGDIVEIDDNGYITILGRAKRFIKIAGEMVPLDNIEDCLRRAWDGLFAVVGIADEKRGERLALMTTVELTRPQIAAMLKENGLPELWQPRDIHVVKEMPLLSTGKIDYPQIVKQLSGG